MKVKPLALSLAVAIWAAVLMLVLGILGNLGIYEGVVEMMQQWHIFFDLSPVGILLGMIEAAVVSFVLALLFVGIYSLLSRGGKRNS